MHEPRFLSGSGERPILTTDEHARLSRQLAELRTIRDRDLPALLRDAHGFVASDAEEEILQIQEDFVAVDARIRHLQQLLRDAQVIDDEWLAPDLAAPGRTVKVRYVGGARIVTYRLAGTSSPEGRTVSLRSPVGQALVGRAVGDVVEAHLPGGRIEQLEILDVRSDP